MQGSPTTQKPWWETDAYTNQDPLAANLLGSHLTGPHGPALVSVFGAEQTTPGWGRETFMENYNKKVFRSTLILQRFTSKQKPFAIVMRSLKVICIDIDGKNGGLEHVTKLGFLPPTVAEVSKSGTGYHLFYETDDTWDAVEGFARHRDRIGIVQGVDIRATGCVYHFPTQLWNNRRLAKLPAFQDRKMREHSLRQQYQIETIKKTLQLDPLEVAIMHDELITELGKDIPDGKRNNTLFAIGSQMKTAQVPDWDEHVRVRAVEVGLDDDEIDKLINNINKYGA